MRPAALLSVLVLWPTLSAAEKTAAKGSGPDIRYAIQDRVEVRCGPSDSPAMYVTNVLHAGDPVEVVGDAGTWLKIRPPAGSYSWINHRLIKQIGNSSNFVVCSDKDEPVYVGSELTDNPPSVHNVSLKEGTQVTSLGKTKANDAGLFLKIEPPPGEYRYVKSRQVSRTRPDAVASKSNLRKQTSAKNPPGDIASDRRAAAASVTPLRIDQADELWRQARQAESYHNYQEAVRLYREAGYGRMKADPGWANKSLDYADWLERAYLRSPYGGVSIQPTGGPKYTGLAGANRIPATPASKLASSDAGSLVSTVRLAAPVSTGNAPPANVTKLGLLRRSGRVVDYQPTYVLENDAYTPPITYVMPQTGLNLESWIGKNVELHGPMVYRGDLRGFVLTAVQAQQP
jgi:SH3-like domain-containing protein